MGKNKEGLFFLLLLLLLLFLAPIMGLNIDSDNVLDLFAVSLGLLATMKIAWLVINKIIGLILNIDKKAP